MYNNLQHVTSLGVRARSLRPSLRRHPRRHPRGRVRPPTPISRVCPHGVVTHAQRRREQEQERDAAVEGAGKPLLAQSASVPNPAHNVNMVYVISSTLTKRPIGAIT